MANPVSTSRCVFDVDAVSCDSPLVQSAYDAAATQPYAGVRNLLASPAYSCSGVFKEGKVGGQLVGAVPRAKIEDLVKKAL